MSFHRKPRLRSAGRRSPFIASVAAAMLAATGCTRTVGEGDPDIDAARNFDRHPLFWVGERFEGWDLGRSRALRTQKGKVRTLAVFGLNRRVAPLKGARKGLGLRTSGRAH